MLKADVFNLEGEKVKEIELNEKIFGREFNPDLVYRVILAMRANRRIPSAHTKFRSEVSGGGRKPWPQKGTGRARHGSIRSPLWKGGGVTFGPRKEKDYSQKINKKEKRVALFSALSQKLRDGEIKIIEEFALKDYKTKEAFRAFQKLYSLSSRSKKIDVLLVVEKFKDDLIKAIRNLEKVKAIMADSLNVEDLLIYKNILMEEKSLEVLEKTFLR